MEDFLIKEFYNRIREINFNAYGLLDTTEHIHTLGTDSKIIGRLFEMFTQPVLEDIAKAHDLILKTPKSQTAYPDFLMMRNDTDTKKIAIDVKTTYITNNSSNIKFTLGSFASYLRNNTKNIEYKYTDYVKHYVIGFVYKRNGAAQQSEIIDYKDRSSITLPYSDVRYFIQEKYKIAGEKPGSGNTENIGSMSTSNIDDLKFGNGPFSELGEDIFNLYWKYYPKYKETTKNYRTLNEFFDWLPCNIDDLELFHEFDKDAILASIKAYRNTH